MKRRKGNHTMRATSMLLLMVFTAHPLWAAQLEVLAPSEFGSLLTIDEAIAHSIRGDADLKRRLARLRKEKALYKGKQAKFFPKFKSEIFEAFATGEENILTYFDTSLEQPIFRGGKTLAEKGKQKIRVEIEELELKEAKRDLELRIRILYAEALKEKELTRIAQGEVKELSKSYGQMKALFEKEVVSRYELAKAETLLQKAKHAVVVHKEAYDYLSFLLIDSVGVGDGISVELEPLRQLPSLSPDIAVYFESMHRNNPNYKLKELLVKEKDFERKALRAEWFPHLSFTTRWNLYRDVFVDANRVMFGIQGDWNIWDFGRLRAEVNAKTFEMEEMKWAGILKIQEVENEIRRLFHAARRAREEIWFMEAFLREKEEAYKNEKASIIVGEDGSAAMLDSFLASEESKMELISAVTEYRILIARLERYADIPSAERQEEGGV